MMSTDPHTYTGARNLGALIPMGATDIIAQSMFADGALIEHKKNTARNYVPTAEEKQKAAQQMSSLFS